MALTKSFDPASPGETVISMVKAAAMVSLNAISVARDPVLMEKIIEALTEFLTLNQRREAKKTVDPTLRVRLLIEEYCAKTMANWKALQEQVAAENA